jgi:hypothetical protein
MSTDHRTEGRETAAADLRDANTLLRRRDYAVRKLVATHIVEALVSSEGSRQKAALHLAKGMDEADANVDDLLNEQLPEDGWAPCSTPVAEQPDNTGWLEAAAVAKASEVGPWGPGVTRHQAAISVVTLHIAEALLDAKSEEVRTWARGLAHELKRERIDLLDEIGRHMQRMALGGPTNEVPF